MIDVYLTFPNLSYTKRAHLIDISSISVVNGYELSLDIVCHRTLKQL